LVERRHHDEPGRKAEEYPRSPAFLDAAGRTRAEWPAAAGLTVVFPIE
jgi:hypothetical protein